MESQECADVKSQQIMHFTHMQLIMLPLECNGVSQHEVMGRAQERMKITETEGGKICASLSCCCGPGPAELWGKTPFPRGGGTVLSTVVTLGGATDTLAWCSNSTFQLLEDKGHVLLIFVVLEAWGGGSLSYYYALTGWIIYWLKLDRVDHKIISKWLQIHVHIAA